MVKRVALIAVIVATVAGVAAPGRAAGTYTRAYAVGSTPGISFKVNPTDEGNPADQVKDATGTPADSVLNMLQGTPVDQNFLAPLKGSPADQNVGGVTFAAGSFSGTPSKLIIADAAGLPVPWSACQLNGPVPVCGANTGLDIQITGCGTGTSGRLLAGFQPGHAIGVWIQVNDSAGIDGIECDGPATTGTVRLVTV